jgi:ribosomal protein S12 methylthiotransferase
LEVKVPPANLRPLRVAFQTLGCAKNTVDSDALAAMLTAAGCDIITQPHRADVLIVNTCGFLDDAKVESIETLLAALRWKSAKRGRRVIAMGCLTQRDGDDVLSGFPELDGVFGVGEWLKMLTAIGANPLAAASFTPLYSGHAGPGSAYLRISDGCTHGCAFCSIPQMRGLYRSERMEDLLREARVLADGGVREIILIGQETTSYGVDLYRSRRLVELCQRLSDIEHLQWIRLLYAHPPTTPPQLVEKLARLPKFVPYLDFPIEHASDRMLKAMNRRTTTQRMRETIAAFRAARPDTGVRTSVIVGFPGETEEDFVELYEFMSEVRFERAGVFVYSPQDGTAGATLADMVEEGIALDRLDRLMLLQKTICLEKHQALIGKTLDVLIEQRARGALWGRGPWDAPEIDGRVRVMGDATPGQIVPVRITRALAYQVEGKVSAAHVATVERFSCERFSELPVLSSR